jgi:hypothetical protein
MLRHDQNKLYVRTFSVAGNSSVSADENAFNQGITVIVFAGTRQGGGGGKNGEEKVSAPIISRLRCS